MDAKTRANFINSVAGGQKIPCPACNTLNDPDSAFCLTCGKPLAKPAAAARTVPETPATEIPFPKAAPVPETPADNPVTPSDSPVMRKIPKTQAPVQAPQTRTPAQPASPVRPAAAPQMEYGEPESVFAEGLPDWDLVPPQVMVRRKIRK